MSQAVGIRLRCLAAFSPGGHEEEIHTGAARADRLLLDAADRDDGAVERELAGRRDPAAVGRRSRPSWRAISSANGSPADGPPTRPRSMSTSTGSSIFASWSTRIPMIARDGSVGARDRADGDVLRPCRLDAASSRTSSPGSCRPISRRSCAGVLTGTPSTATITSSGFSSFAAGTSAETLVDEHATRRRDDVVAQSAERDDRRDLLRALHVGRVLPVALGVRGSVRSDRLLGDERGAVRPRERQQAARAGESVRTKTST